jgi:CheY-like chemotaxis protein
MSHLALEGKKALVVDDEWDIAEYIVERLEELGCTTVDYASNGQEALEKCTASQEKESRYDLIVSDSKMPKMTGLEFLEQLRTNWRYSNVPVLMVTAVNELQHAEKAYDRKVNVNDFLIKPFEPELLDEKILKLLKAN